MITIPCAIVIIMYILGNVLSVISLYILFTHAGLHNNFRMVVILLISFGILRSIAVYLLAASNYVADEATREDLKSNLVAAFVYAICGFAISSLFLSIERCIAVYKPKQYERNSTAAVLPCTTLVTTLILTFVLGFWANKNGENQIPLITVTTAAGFISLIVSFSISMWIFHARVAYSWQALQEENASHEQKQFRFEPVTSMLGLSYLKMKNFAFY
ncbi:unnamed protein product [Cylicostephanus goldi]|uniref:G-protein coupled receptors family 1 profile domain-containing protein n=1 Tax=Cylicostephanus goldi TaxID=71465 RepID=A0A3P6RRT0_CYLGO|nr:unnamed protein product [Cylicostephanus goldi]